MGLLAVAYVFVGLAPELVPGLSPSDVSTFEFGLTVLFGAEFALRFLGARDRWGYLRSHFLDLVALLPLARGLRAARLVRLIRLVRLFSGLNRAFGDVERLSNHRALGTLVIAWLGTMFLSSTVFYAMESGANSDLQRPHDALWWGIATLTGGSAGVEPVTDEGRIAAGFLLLVGVALFTAITASLVSFFVNEDRSRAGQIESRLREATDLQVKGLLTPTEFDAKRREILAAL